MIVVPLVGGAVNAHQTFSQLLGDNLLEFRLNYVTTQKQWSMDVSRNGETVINGAMLEAGVDITSTHSGADIGRLVMVGDDVTLDNLGTANQLVWISS